MPRLATVVTHVLFLFDDPAPVMLCGARVRILEDASLQPADADFVGDLGLVTIGQGALVDCPACRASVEVVMREQEVEAGRSWVDAVRRLNGGPF